MTLWSRFRRRWAERRPAPPRPPIPTDLETIGRALVKLDWGLGIFRLVHLLDALRRTPHATSILSLGSGGGLHEAYLARLFPSRTVVAADLHAPEIARDVPNLSFLQGNLLDPSFRSSLPRSDFVYSIECLEHIEDDVSVLDGMAESVTPGGTLYIQVPFANEAEQADPALRKHELQHFEHVRPGYDGRTLRRMVESRGCRADLVAGAFWFPLQTMLWTATERLGPERFAPHWRELLRLAESDLRDAVPDDRSQAIAIKIVATRVTDPLPRTVSSAPGAE